MRNAVISVSIVHHCERIEGQPSRSIERIGSDEVAAVEAWNLRACPQAGISLADTSHRIL